MLNFIFNLQLYFFISIFNKFLQNSSIINYFLNLINFNKFLFMNQKKIKENKLNHTIIIYNLILTFLWIIFDAALISEISNNGI